MNFKDFKEVLFERNDVIEYTTKDLQYSKITRLAYYIELIKKIPKMWFEGRPNPPFIVVVHFKDKNGCFQDLKDISLEDIMYITKISRSDLVI